MSEEGRVIHRVSEYDRARYLVEVRKDAGAWRWDHHIATNVKSFALSEAERVVRIEGHWEARVVDREAKEEGE